MRNKKKTLIKSTTMRAHQKGSQVNTLSGSEIKLQDALVLFSSWGFHSLTCFLYCISTSEEESSMFTFDKHAIGKFNRCKKKKENAF
jgi:hypothetical protein